MFTAIPPEKRRLLARTVRRVLGTPADYRAGTTRWLAYSDESIDWNDVRRLIAAVEGVASFPDFPKRGAEDDEAAAPKVLADWLKDRLPAPPKDDENPAVLYARPWLRFTTEGMEAVE